MPPFLQFLLLFRVKDYLCIFFDIFFGNSPEFPFRDDFISPFLFTGMRKLSLAGQPLFWLQEGANTANEHRKARKTRKRYFFIQIIFYHPEVVRSIKC